MVFEPPRFVAVKLTSKVPAVWYTWEGFCAADVAVPSPKFHDQLVGDPVEVSVNCTIRGAVPLAGVTVKDAVGAGGGGTVTWIAWAGDVDDVPPASVTVR